MEKRTLTITVDPDWRRKLREAANKGGASAYQGETLNFQRADEFFSWLTGKRWRLVHELVGAGEMSIRELARRVGRDVKRVHGDVQLLQRLGLIERTATGGVVCPYSDIHVDIHVMREAA